MTAPALHHLALRTRDVARLCGFYRHWLGLAVLREQGAYSVWLGLGEGALLMIERAEADEPDVPKGSRELMAFAVTVERRRELRAALVAAGALEAETEHTLYTRDPDGRRVGFSSYPVPAATSPESAS